jgi:hypothetical protein
LQSLREGELARFSNRTAADIHEAIREMPLSDVHCHAFESMAELTEREFLEELSLAAFMMGAYFPAGVYQQWREGMTPLFKGSVLMNGYFRLSRRH